MSSPPFESYAQNFEDVVLWRALRDVAQGAYVDVGARDPVVESVTWAFYRQGWRGVLVEPVPSLAAALRHRRPEDVTVATAAGSRTGTARLFAAPTTGDSTLIEAYAAETAEAGIEVEELTVPVAPLDSLLVDAGLDGRRIHFCTIDVEGSEADVLAGFDLDRWRPWVLVIEATEPRRPEPRHGAWEPRVLDAGYEFCLFDGLNRFYAHRREAGHLVARLSYPACIFDEGFTTGRTARGSSFGPGGAAQKSGSTIDELEAMKRTFSWRVTRPLRSMRRAQLNLSRRRRPQPTLRRPTSLSRGTVGGAGRDGASGDPRIALARRLSVVASVLTEAPAPSREGDLDHAFADLEGALEGTSASDDAKAWLSLVAVTGSYPGERGLKRVARIGRMDGPGAIARELRAGFDRLHRDGFATTASLDVVRYGAVVDVSHTLDADIHTGIQRVVRETVGQWLRAGRPVTLAAFSVLGSLRRLSSEEVERLATWRDHLDGSRDTRSTRPTTGTPDILVPWGIPLVVPEFFADSVRLGAYRALGPAGALASFSVVGYDLIPVTAAETVMEAVAAKFPEYLAAVKHADRVSAISSASANDFASFAAMTASQGLSAPVVAAQTLPAEANRVSEETMTRCRSSLGIRAMPLVLSVGSHEPRKNHLSLLEAAERLWERGLVFQLLLIGGSSWKADELAELVDELRSRGRALDVRSRCTEEELWSAYTLSRFTVFPSLLEGFGLPVAESLAVGTPVITSNYGSMAEIAADGGCLLVDPRDVRSLENAMGRLLRDDELLERLRSEATARPRRGWADYADDVWGFLVENRS